MAGKPDRLARLVAALDHPDKKIIREAVDALVALAPSQPEVGGEVEAALMRAPVYKRWPMAYVLAQIGPPSDACFSRGSQGNQAERRESGSRRLPAPARPRSGAWRFTLCGTSAPPMRWRTRRCAARSRTPIRSCASPL